MSSRQEETLPVLERFQDNLRHFISLSGLSQEEVAFLAALNRTQVNMMLSRKSPRDARVSTLIRVAGALEVEPYRLLEGITWDAGNFSSGAFKVAPRPVRLEAIGTAEQQ